MSAAEPEVRDNPNLSRYELSVDGAVVGVAEYSDVGLTRTFRHTEIDRSMRGRGLGATLIRAALDDARASGRGVIARCPEVAHFIDEHPEYADLLVL